jgi:BirA family biotin operon repressor/biotin-[acetyl-CoA-carboxylase] ligase
LAVFRRVPSTHAIGRRLVHEYTDEGADLPIFDLVAWEQVSGQGRDGRSWSSPPGAGAWISLVRPCLRGPLQRLPLLVAVALCETLEPWLGDRCRLKWPNDLVVRAEPAEGGWRKLAGILIAASTRTPDCGHAVISFGLNTTAELESLGEPGATSLRALATAEPPTLAELADRLIEGVDGRLGPGDGGRPGGLEADDLPERYRALSLHQPGDMLRCRTGEESVEGTFLGFDEHGFLRLEVAGKEQRIGAGEILEPALPSAESPEGEDAADDSGADDSGADGYD